MGKNNKQRRAAKRRERVRRHREGEPGPRRPTFDSAETYGRVQRDVEAILRLLVARKVDDLLLRRRLEALLRDVAPAPHGVVVDVLAIAQRDALRRVRAGGWDDPDLHELVIHHDGRLMRALDAGLRGITLPASSLDALAGAVRLTALLRRVPVFDSRAVADRRHDLSGIEHPKLRQVRALLAKAESTEFDEEAAALMAKAQELISRHSLQALVTSSTSSRGGAATSVRRLWLDAPYVRAKACLVHHVAEANRCRAAASDELGFCVVVGAETDLQVVELLVTSLLVQAQAALLRHAREGSSTQGARTRSFRRAFLMAYAQRIGDRLSKADEAVVAEGGNAMLPALRRHDVAVTEAFEAYMPHTTSRRTTVSNEAGWAAGVVAADLAQLGVGGQLAAPVARLGGAG